MLDALNNNGLIVCPTDTVYSFAAKLGSPKGFDRLARAKGVKPEKAHFSLLCADLSDLSRYAQHISNPLFKTMKRLLPGPYTFVLPASGEVPKLYKGKRKPSAFGFRTTPWRKTCSESSGLPLWSAACTTKTN